MLSECYPRRIDKNPRHIHVTQEVYPTGISKTYTGQEPKTYTCYPTGIPNRYTQDIYRSGYLLGDGYTSWVTRVKCMLCKTYRQEPNTYICYARRIPNRYTQDIYRSRTQDIYMLPKTYTQQIYPIHIYTSWVTGIPLE